MNSKSTRFELISLAFILLFVYASLSKLLDYEDFRMTLAKSPLLADTAGTVAWVIPSTEIIVSILFLFDRTKRIAMISAFTLMTIFSFYIIAINYFSEFIPCSCGGILAKLTWTQHLFFNLVFVVAGGVGVYLSMDAAKRVTFILAPAFISSALIVLALFVGTYDSREKYSSFEANFVKSSPVLERGFNLGYNSFYFSGYDSFHLYLGNYSAPRRIVEVDHLLSDSSHAIIDAEELSSPSFRIKTAGPDFYLLNGTVPAMHMGKIGAWRAKKISSNSPYFAEALPIAHSSFIVRSLDEDSEYQLAKTDGSESHFRWSRGILDKQIDGLFCVDGMLKYNEPLQRIIYVYYYRNQFMVMDTSMNLLYRANTIDTIGHAKIKVVKSTLSNDQYSRGASLIVNRLTCTSGDFLFIQSAIRAKNETKEIFGSTARIDVYSLLNGGYCGSLRLFVPENSKLLEFQVIGSSLFVLSGDYLTKYDISVPLKELSL